MRFKPSIMASGGLVLAGLTATARAVERFPPPDFESGHTLPLTTTPSPDPAWYAYMDTAVLLGTLILAAVLVLQRRSRSGVVAVGLFCLAYFGFWRRGCVCSIGSIQNIALALFDPTYALPWVVAVFFALPMVFTLLFGRVFCAGVCPLGVIQDVVVLRPVRLPEWLETPLRMLRHLYLALALLLAATGSLFVVCEYDPFIAIFRLSGQWPMLVFGAVLLLAGMFVARPYCRYLCPYGLLLGWLSQASRWHARVDPERCIRCRLCERSCPVNAIDPPTVGIADATRKPGAWTRRGRWLTLAALPVLATLGWYVGAELAPASARFHFDVRLADALRSEPAGLAPDVRDALAAYRATGRPPDEALNRAAAVESRFAFGTPIAGGFVGLVFAFTLIRLTRPGDSDEYLINRSRCVSCARCFKYCPHDPGNLEMLTRLTAEGRATA